MCFQDIEQHKLILEKGKEFLKVAFDIDKDLISNIINNSKNIVDNYNTEKLTVTDATKWERGTFRGVTKTILKPYFFKNYLKKLESRCIELGYIKDIEESDLICDDCKDIRNYRNEYGNYSIKIIKDYKELCCKCKPIVFKHYELSEIMQKTHIKVNEDFKKSIENTKFSDELMNKYILLNRKKNVVNHELEKAIRENLRLQIIKEYQEQNQDLINKYN